MKTSKENTVQATTENNAGMLAMLNQNVSDLVVTAKKATTKQYDALSNEEKEKLHKMILVNKQNCSAAQFGETKKVKFFEISPESAKTPKFTREFEIGQNVKYQKDGQLVTEKLQGFKPTGTNHKITYKNEAKEEVTFLRGGISIIVKDGMVSLNRVTIVE